MKRPQTKETLVETSFGEARYSISHNGELKLYWQQHITIFGISYYAVSATPTSSYIEVSGYPTSAQRSGGLTAAAQKAVKNEYTRLHEMLVTPEAIQQAKRDYWLYREYSAWQDVERAREELDKAIATFEERRQERRNGMGLTEDDLQAPSLEELLAGVSSGT